MSVSDQLQKKLGFIERNVQLATEEIAEAARPWAPFKTGQLAAGIDTLPPIQEGKRVVGIVISQAQSADGFNYAKFQTENTLGHFHPEGVKHNFSGFASVGDGQSLEEQYRSGYAKERKAGKNEYEINYLAAGYLDAKDRVKKIMENLH